MAMTIDDKLGKNRFCSDHSYAHIELDQSCQDKELIERIIMACPAQLYRQDEDRVGFNYEGCLECGTCRVIAQGAFIKSWNHPMGGMGVQFRMG